jgi:hypothetical protein
VAERRKCCGIVIISGDIVHRICGLASAKSRVYIIRYDDILEGLGQMARKDDPATVEYETLAKNLLKGELKRRGVTYASLAEKLTGIGVHENERNLNNKISRGGFSAAFMLQCLHAIEAKNIQLE